MALSYSLIRAEAVRTNSPVEAFQQVNQHLLQMNSSSMFVTSVYGILDCDSGDFHFARAAHPAPYLLDGQGRWIEITPAFAQPLGLFDNPPVDEQTIQIPPDGILLLYSDGVTETMDLQGVEFGFDSLYQTMRRNRARPPQEICEQLWQDVQAHAAGSPQQDDFTSVIVKRLGQG
jgi:serine phosphatase RsbU (regulator of sigma subunit)